MRSGDSHKGDNGSVAIIGGSRHQHGAPLFSALAAEASGVDLLYVWVPMMHEEIAKKSSLNFQVYTFGSEKSDEISSGDRTRMIEHLATLDSVVIGPGLSRTPSSIKSILELLSEIPCPIVADASALQHDTMKALAHRHAVVTPHLGELERMGLMKTELQKIAEKNSTTFLLKSMTDTVVAEDGSVRTIEGGNAGLTVGGTGDALAGLTAGLIAQAIPNSEAAFIASTVIKRAGEMLLKEVGFSYTTIDVIRMIPRLLKDILKA